MRFLVDECTGPAVARWLRGLSYEVYSVYEEARGMADADILSIWTIMKHVDYCRRHTCQETTIFAQCEILQFF